MTISRRSADTSIGELYHLMGVSPLKALDQSSRAGLIASHVLNTLERQTGLKARLEDILDVIERHAGSKVRCGRLLGTKQQYMLFRDSSFLVLIPTGDKHHFIVMPVALSLDLGFHQRNQFGGELKVRVAQGKRGAESLCIAWETEDHLHDLPLPARIADLTPELREILGDVEKISAAIRHALLALPTTERPTQGMVDEGLVERVGNDGLWKGSKGLIYWPAYLSSPYEITPDLDRARTFLQDLGSLALWAYPSLPDTLEVSIYSLVETDKVPSLLSRFPSSDCRAHSYGMEDLPMQSILRDEFQMVCSAYDLELPVGHQTQFSWKSVRPVGFPVAKVIIKRPDARRALWLEQEYGTAFRQVETYSNPSLMIEQQDCLDFGPNPMRFQMAKAPGKSFTLHEAVQDMFEAMHLGPLEIAMAGGERAAVLRAMTFGLNEEIPAQGYQTNPFGSHDHFRYSLLAGPAHDVHMRRPLGYTTLSGSLVETLARHPDDSICGLTVAPCAMRINIEHIATDERIMSSSPRGALIAAATHAILNFLSDLWEQARERNVHFELGISVDHLGGVTTSSDAGLLTWALAQLRARIAASDIFARHISIANISRDWAGGTVI